MTRRYDDLADRLSSLSEELADLALDELRAALRSGQQGRPASEKKLTQARRAVEKAVSLLRSADLAQSADGDDESD